ncbi:MAG: biotin transporter BioY [Spirochaetes bacterium]|nr:biotin transporter BioY [Spirochaetota bacterium]
MNASASLVRPAAACLFAALISVGAYIAVPLPFSPVPIVLQNFFIILAALLLGPKWGFVATLVYLGLGAAGLPVFAGGTGGLARFFGPTGGYLLGYVPAVVAMGFLGSIGKPRAWKFALAALAGSVIVYAAGVGRLKYALDADWGKALALGLLPFIPGDLAKIALAAVVASRVKPRIDGILRPDGAGA